MSREQSERAPKQGFGDSENDTPTGSTAVRQPRIEQVSVNLTVNGRNRTIDRTPLAAHRAFIFSLFAALFWMVSAFGRTLTLMPWKTSQPVPPEQPPAHQTKWRAWAAFCAAVATVSQALTFLIRHPLFP
jgi:hypothetical protein